MTKMQADEKVDAARAKIQSWGYSMTQVVWDWHSLGHSLKLVHEAIELAPTYQRPWTLLADIYHRIGMSTLAEKCLKRSYKLATPGPRYPGGFYREVQEHLSTGYPFDRRGGLSRQVPPEWFRLKYQRHWSIDEVSLVLKDSPAPSKVATAFLSYGREDVTKAERLRSDLLAAGIAVWMDTHDLDAGVPWADRIREEIGSRDFVICCLSSTSVSKTGFFQAEMKVALEWQQLRPSGVVFLIPARLDECPIPSPLRPLQCTDLFHDWTDGITRIVASIYKHSHSQ